MATLDTATNEIDEPQGITNRQTVLALEVLVVLLFAYSTSFLAQFLITWIPTYGTLLPLVDLFSDLGRLVPLLFLVWVADGNLDVLGLTKPKWLSDSLVGLGFLAVLILILILPRMLLPYDLYHQLSRPMKPSFLAREAISGIRTVELIPYILASAAFQEILMRGYFVGRLRTLVGNNWLPVVVSSILFGIWHVYQGPIGAMSATVMGIVFALYFAKYNRIWPLILVHFLYNVGISVQLYMYYQHIRL